VIFNIVDNRNIFGNFTLVVLQQMSSNVGSGKNRQWTAL